AAVGARAEGDDVLRLRHLLVEPLDRRRHLVGHGAGHDHQVGLPRPRRERDHAEPDEVVPGHRGRDELDRATRQAEVEDPQGVAAPPVEQEAHRLRRGARAGPERWSGKIDSHVQANTPLRQAYTSPTVMKPMKIPISITLTHPRRAKTVAQGNRNTASTAN